MFCIAAFLVFAILGIFSASYRPLVAQAWHCVLRRVTFKPCDINFAEEVKGRLIGKLVVRHPGFARFLNRWIDWLALIFVVLSVWSALYLLNAGLNLWVYDTCNPTNVESCSLSGEACGIDQSSIGFIDALQQGKLGTWVANPFIHFAETVSRIPDRLKRWEPKDYFGPTATTYYPSDPAKPDALEILDPGCKYCRELFGTMKQVGFEKTRNLSYLLYPIQKTGTGGYKFAHSPLVAAYVEATKLVPLRQNPSGVAPDWQLLEKIFGEKPDRSVDWQTYFNIGATRDEVQAALQQFLQEIGYTRAEVRQIDDLAASEGVQSALQAQRVIVESKLRTIKIPTLLFGGRRFDRAVDADTLSVEP